MAGTGRPPMDDVVYKVRFIKRAPGVKDRHITWYTSDKEAFRARVVALGSLVTYAAVWDDKGKKVLINK